MHESRIRGVNAEKSEAAHIMSVSSAGKSFRGSRTRVIGSSAKN
jgi:hypothetical protein